MTQNCLCRNLWYISVLCQTDGNGGVQRKKWGARGILLWGTSLHCSVHWEHDTIHCKADVVNSALHCISIHCTKDQSGKKQTPEALKIGNRLEQSIVTSQWIILDRWEKYNVFYTNTIFINKTNTKIQIVKIKQILFDCWAKRIMETQ